jgi:hypothetical protein
MSPESLANESDARFATRISLIRITGGRSFLKNLEITISSRRPFVALDGVLD